jgi:hypothetical protein
MITNYTTYIKESIKSTYTKLLIYNILNNFFKKYLKNTIFELKTVQLYYDDIDVYCVSHKNYEYHTQNNIKILYNLKNKNIVIDINTKLFKFNTFKELEIFLYEELNDKYYEIIYDFLIRVKMNHVQNVIILDREKYSKFILKLINTDLNYLKCKDMYYEFLIKEYKDKIDNMLKYIGIQTISNANNFDLI